MSSPRALDTVLGKTGPLAQKLPGFTPRPQQIALAQAVNTALVQGRPCLAEAGTGVGKTLAYLVPLVRWLDKTRGKAIVSTHTLALQAQLIERDIPLLLAALPDLKIEAGALKGRGNFLCLQDLSAASGELWTQGDPQFRQIQRWANETDTGDVSELDFTFRDWHEIAANPDTCRQRECRFFDRCFYFKARKAAEDCNLLVVNHALFFADLRLRAANTGGPTLLPQYDAVVFDEAHHIDDMATRAFGLEWGSRRVPQLVAKARRLAEGAFDPMKLASLEALNQTLLDPFQGANVAEAFTDEVLQSPRDREAFMGLRDDLCRSLESVAKDLNKFADIADDTVARDRAAGLARTAVRISTELYQVTKETGSAIVADPSPAAPAAATDENADAAPEAAPPPAATPEYFRWFHARKLRTGQTMATLVKTPLDVSDTLREHLFSKTPRVVFASATLASSGGFGYLKERLGLCDAPGITVSADASAGGVEAPVEIVQGSPFDYERNALLYIPRHLTPNAGDDYANRLADEVLNLVEAAGGRTFALFTSHRMLKLVQERLWGQTDFPLFTQGEMPNARLVEAFKESGEGVLLGTSSFWEGVDVPGPALSCVIIDKLPFATPDSPVQRARESAVRARGGDAFRELSLPQAQIRLKQGVGRLLRSASDRGVIALLDARLWTKSYGRAFLSDLPPCPRTEQIEDVRTFFAQEKNAKRDPVAV